MRIGIDIDGVLTDYERFSYDYFSKYCIENKIDYHILGSQYETCDTFNVNKNTEKQFWKKHLNYYATDYPARHFASEVIKKLKEEGNEIYIITARTLTDRQDESGQKMRETVEDWLAKNMIEYDKIIYCKRPTYNKINEVNNYKIDIMIEDSPQNIEKLSKLIPVIIFHSEYNKNCNLPNTTRCYSWYDIYNTIQNKSC